jgi:anaerobic selenocysteine-containing dehydrogenase
MCGLVITTDGGKITDIRGDKEDVFSRGHICPKGPAMRELQEDPDRKRRPMRRLASGEWEKTSWEAAFELSASRIKDIQREHGRDAVGIYIGNPTVHNHGATIMLQAFTRALGSKNRFDANSMDANPKLLSCLLMYGDPTAIPIPDVDRTEYMLILGANPAASNGSLMTLGDVRGRMQAIRERGGKIVLVDPRRTETAAWASEHHFIRPGGDAPLLLAILHVLFADDLIARARAAELATGLSDLEAVCRPFPPERVAARLGMDAGAIRLAKVKKAPHGIDLGALQEGRRSEKVQHKAGKVALAPRILVEDVKRIDGWLADGASDRLVLIGRRHVRSNNSWMHNVHSLTKGPDRAELFVNPTDGARLGVADGQTVKAKSRVGAVTARVKLTDEVMPGVVSLPHGFGHARAKDTLRIAGALSAPSINDLTDEQRVEGLSGTAVLNGTPISIEPT